MPPTPDRLALVRRLAILVATLVLAMAPTPAPALHGLFAPKAELWERWTAHDPSAPATIDHRPWQRFLEGYVRRDAAGLNRVAYGRVGAADKAALERYLGGLAATPISGFRRPEQLAYWINLYNGLTVKLVLEYRGVESIRDIDISPGLVSDGPWGRKLIEVEGVPVSLDDIEHRILRPIWRDPRLHYALNCAAEGCPNLPLTAFTGRNAEALLTRSARDFVNSGRGVRFEHGELVVSSLYVWFKADFGGSDAAVIAHLRRYAEPALAARLAAHLAARRGIDDDAYDWTLNRGP